MFRWLILSSILTCAGSAFATDLATCQSAHKQAVQDCGDGIAAANETNNSAAADLQKFCANPDNQQSCEGSQSQLQKDSADRLNQAKQCQDPIDSCKASCDPSSASKSQQSAISKERSQCMKDIAKLQGQAAPGAQQAGQASPQSQNSANNSQGNKSSSSPMSIPPITPPQSPQPQPQQQAQAPQSTTTPTAPNCTASTALTTSAPAGCENQIVADQCGTLAISSGTGCGDVGFQQKMNDKCAGETSQLCNQYQTAMACAQIAQSGGQMPANCQTQQPTPPVAADGGMIPNSTAASSFGGGGGNGGGMMGASAGSLPSLNPAAPQKKALQAANREGMSMAVDGGGGGSSSSGGKDDLGFDFGLNRKPASAPAASVKAGGLATMSLASDVGKRNTGSVLAVVSEVYHKRCLAGKLLHCGTGK